MELLYALLISISLQFGISQDEAKRTPEFKQTLDQQVRDGLVNDNGISVFL
jgi:hypothetical protein